MKTPQTQPPAAGEAAHTPTPYSLHTAYDCRYSPAIEEIVVIGKGVGVAKILKSGRSGQDQATAAFIVRACNAYATQQARIKELEKSVSELAELLRYDGRGHVLNAVDRARAALAAAKSA